MCFTSHIPHLDSAIHNATRTTRIVCTVGATWGVLMYEACKPYDSVVRSVCQWGGPNVTGMKAAWPCRWGPQQQIAGQQRSHARQSTRLSFGHGRRHGRRCRGLGSVRRMQRRPRQRGAHLGQCLASRGGRPNSATSMLHLQAHGRGGRSDVVASRNGERRKGFAAKP